MPSQIKPSVNFHNEANGKTVNLVLKEAITRNLNVIIPTDDMNATQEVGPDGLPVYNITLVTNESFKVWWGQVKDWLDLNLETQIVNWIDKNWAATFQPKVDKSLDAFKAALINDPNSEYPGNGYPNNPQQAKGEIIKILDKLKEEETNRIDGDEDVLNKSYKYLPVGSIIYTNREFSSSSDEIFLRSFKKDPMYKKERYQTITGVQYDVKPSGIQYGPFGTLTSVIGFNNNLPNKLNTHTVNAGTLKQNNSFSPSFCYDNGTTICPDRTGTLSYGIPADIGYSKHNTLNLGLCGDIGFIIRCVIAYFYTSYYNNLDIASRTKNNLRKPYVFRVNNILSYIKMNENFLLNVFKEMSCRDYYDTTSFKNYFMYPADQYFCTLMTTDSYGSSFNFDHYFRALLPIMFNNYIETYASNYKKWTYINLDFLNKISSKSSDEEIYNYYKDYFPHDKLDPDRFYITNATGSRMTITIRYLRLNSLFPSLIIPVFAIFINNKITYCFDKYVSQSRYTYGKYNDPTDSLIVSRAKYTFDSNGNLKDFKKHFITNPCGQSESYRYYRNFGTSFNFGSSSDFNSENSNTVAAIRKVLGSTSWYTIENYTDHYSYSETYTLEVNESFIMAGDLFNYNNHSNSVGSGLRDIDGDKGIYSPKFKTLKEYRYIRESN